MPNHSRVTHLTAPAESHPPASPERRPSCLGVLLTNLGTPDAPQPAALRRYLAEFLSDPRVIELPRWLWLPILHGFILRARPRRSARAYAKIWDEQGSPLLSIGRAQARALQASLDARLQGPVRVELAMRYGSPGIAEACAHCSRPAPGAC